MCVCERERERDTQSKQYYGPLSLTRPSLIKA